MMHGKSNIKLTKKTFLQTLLHFFCRRMLAVKFVRLPVWACHICVPAREARNLYWKVDELGMGHCVTMGTPSITGVSFWGWPRQWIPNPWPGTRFTISTTSMSFSHTCKTKTADLHVQICVCMCAWVCECVRECVYVCVIVFSPLLQLKLQFYQLHLPDSMCNPL
jgi:hypothetical protein